MISVIQNQTDLSVSGFSVGYNAQIHTEINPASRPIVTGDSSPWKQNG
jgi:hypothetical protein